MKKKKRCHAENNRKCGRPFKNTKSETKLRKGKKINLVLFSSFLYFCQNNTFLRDGVFYVAFTASKPFLELRYQTTIFPYFFLPKNPNLKKKKLFNNHHLAYI